MKKIIVLMVLMLLFCSTYSFAKVVTVPAGTAVDIVNMQTLVSGELTRGDLVQMQVANDVTIDNTVVIKKGAIVDAEITESSKATYVKLDGTLGVRISSTKSVDGQFVFLRSLSSGNPGDRIDDDTMVTAGLSGFCCPLFALQKGEDRVVPAGQRFQAVTVSDLKVKVEK